MKTIESGNVDWDKMQDLVPAVIQDSNSGEILTLGYMNEAALLKTLSSQKVTFFSRKKQELWTKGESSGNYLELDAIDLDCDQDALLIQATPKGPTCHLGNQSCFDKKSLSKWSVIAKLEERISERAQNPSRDSYTSELLENGSLRIAQKVGEEAVETVIAAISKSEEELSQESADLIFHLLVLLKAKGVSFSDVLSVLSQRFSKSSFAL